MINGRFVGFVGAALLGAVVVQSAQAQSYPSRATPYNVSLVRATDECVGPGVTVVNPGNVAGCLQANVVTDAALTDIGKGTVKVSRGGKGGQVRLVGRGFGLTGTPLGLQLSIRVSNTLGTPLGSKTYEDQTIICGINTGGACGNFTNVEPDGRVRFRQTLDECLTANGLSLSLGQGNIEIHGASLINCDTGKVAAVPGILQDK